MDDGDEDGFEGEKGVLKKSEHVLKLGFQYWQLDRSKYWQFTKTKKIPEIKLGNMQDLCKESFPKRLKLEKKIN